MLFGPIFRTEMLTVARRRRYFLLRVAYGALALLVLWISYSTASLYSYNSEQTTSIQASQMLATQFFNSFSWLQMLAILVVGPAMAAGTIATERERRTIEYLFATDLSNSEIVLGKTIARLCLLGQFVLVGLPILFIFRMLGGIATELLLSTFLLASSTAVLMTALGVCASVWSPKSREATIRCYSILFAALVLPPFLGFLGSLLARSTGSSFWEEYGVPLLSYFQLLNPLGPLISGTSSGQLELAAVVPTMLAQLLVAVGLLLLSVVAVRRVHLSETTRSAQPKSAINRPIIRSKARPIGNNPMIWKEMVSRSSRSRIGIAGRIALDLILGLLLMSSAGFFIDVMWGWSSTMEIDDYKSYLMSITMMTELCMLLLLAVNAAGLISSERERDCWLSLIATPMTGQEIMFGKTLGNLYSMRWPLFVLAFSWMLGVVLDPELLISALAVLFTLLLIAWYVTNLGLYFSLRSQTTMRSMGATLATLCFFGGGYLMCCCPIMSGPGGGDEMLIFLTPCIPFLLAASAVASEALSEDDLFFREKAVPVAYFMGHILYLIAGAGLYAIARSEFDTLAGRCGKIPEGQMQ